MCGWVSVGTCRSPVWYASCWPSVQGTLGRSDASHGPFASQASSFLTLKACLLVSGEDSRSDACCEPATTPTRAGWMAGGSAQQALSMLAAAGSV